MYRVIEQGIKSETDDMTACKDGIFAGEAFAAVAGGVNGKGSLLWNGGAGRS